MKLIHNIIGDLSPSPNRHTPKTIHAQLIISNILFQFLHNEFNINESTMNFLRIIIQMCTVIDVTQMSKPN